MTILKYIIPLIAFLALLPAAARAQAADERNTLRLAQTYEQAGKFEDALRFYRDLYRMNPSNTSYFDGMRRTLTGLKRYDEVTALIGEQLQRRPGDFQLWIFRGGVYLQRELPDSAEADWEHAIAMNPKNGQVYSLIADQCVNTRQFDTAIDYLRRGREALKAPQLFAFEIARASAMHMDFETAMNEYLGYLRAVPQALYQIQQQISMFSEIPQALDAALRAAEEQTEEFSDSEPIHYLLAWLHMERKDYASAYSVYRDIDEMKNARGMELLKFASRAFNDRAYREAADAYAETVERFPDQAYIPQAEFQHARSLEALYEKEGVPEELHGGDTRYPSTESVSSYQGAIRLYEGIAARYPGHPMASESLYRVGYLKYHRFGDHDGALEILREIADTRRTVFSNTDADILIGDVLLAQGDLEASIAQYDAVLGARGIEEQNRRVVLFRIAEAYFFKGEFDTVLVQLKPLTDDVGNDIANDALALAAMIAQYRMPGERPLQHYARVLFLERQRKLSEAAALARSMTEEFAATDLVDLAWLKLAQLQAESGAAGDAASTYAGFLEQRSESFLRDRALFHFAKLQEEALQQQSAALETYQKLLTDYPNSPFAPQARERIVALRKGNS
ncbi:MAG: hypothetical protein C0600_09175 [Ignavibacteria bacterium]|nr:MAG: hypothetical protein C0600_09175 [Ignavibacteria bacterium]